MTPAFPVDTHRCCARICSIIGQSANQTTTIKPNSTKKTSLYLHYTSLFFPPTQSMSLKILCFFASKNPPPTGVWVACPLLRGLSEKIQSGGPFWLGGDGVPKGHECRLGGASGREMVWQVERWSQHRFRFGFGLWDVFFGGRKWRSWSDNSFLRWKRQEVLTFLFLGEKLWLFTQKPNVFKEVLNNSLAHWGESFGRHQQWPLLSVAHDACLSPVR